MRFVIRVHVDSAVAPTSATLTVSSDTAGLTWTRTRTIALAADTAGGLMPLPPEPVAAGEPHAALCGGDTAAFLAALADFRSRRTASANTFGRYLFAVLLGPDWWPQIRALPRPVGDGLVELALAWPSAPAFLSFERLPWELLAPGPTPLVASDDPRVAITRLVARPGEDPRPSPPALDLPPRVLFVVGTTLRNPRIRAATEILSILRGIESPERSIHATLIEEASPARVLDAVKTQRPQVVHFICHGDVENGDGWLELMSDKKGEGPIRCRSARLLEMLRPDGAPAPPVVVLGACRSASTTDDPPGKERTSAQLAAAPGEPVAIASLGARLVAGGVPIVIGMAGRVADVAARLFTERFQASVMGGEPLVSATAYARRAPFVAGAPGVNSIDWAYPTVLLDEGVDPGYTPTPAGGDSHPGDKLAAWLGAYSVTDEMRPVFCHRQEFIDDFDRLLGKSGRGLLVAYTQPGATDEGARWGKTRVLEQMAFRAARSGHLPFFVFRERASPPRLLADALDLWVGQLEFYAKELGLTLPDLLTGTVLRTVRGSASIDEAQAEARTAQAAAAADRAAAPGTARHAVREQLATQVDRVLRDRPGRAGCLALAFDLLTLVGGFQARLAQFRADVVAAGRIVPPWLEEPTRARPIVLLDNVDQYDRSILEEILALAGQGGLGNAESPVPVVLSAALDGGPATTVLKPLVESRKPHLLARRLDPFPAADAMLVYQAVLLHPFNPALFEFGDVKSSIPFAPAAIVAADVARNVEDFFAVMLKGRPDRLAKEALYAAAREGVSKDYLIPADDTAIVKTLGIVR